MVTLVSFLNVCFLAFLWPLIGGFQSLQRCPCCLSVWIPITELQVRCQLQMHCQRLLDGKLQLGNSCQSEVRSHISWSLCWTG